MVRVPVWFRLNKGVFMVTRATYAWREIGRSDVVSILPQIGRAVGAWCGSAGKPLLTYHCDLEMPPL